jgi:hypothetical protein
VTTTTETDTPPVEPVATSCPRCGSPMRPDQDWCLNCGAAVTSEVSGARGWRAPIMVVGTLLAVAAVALVLAFVKLSDDDKTVAQAPATRTPAPTAAAPAPTATPAPTTGGTGVVPGATPTPIPTIAGTGESQGTPGATPTPGGTGTGTGTGTTTGTGGFASWPSGTTAYTVILWSATSRSEARTKAQALQAAGQSNLGILHSNDYSSLRAGYWVVFSGQYESNDEAQSAAQSAQATAPGAYAKQVKP